MPTPEHAAFSFHIEMLKSMAANCAKSYDQEGGLEYLFDLHDLSDQIESAIDTAEKMLHNAAIEKFGKFVPVKSFKFGLAYARTTRTYAVPEESEYRKDVLTRRADNDKINAYLEERGKLPEGITENVSIAINFKKPKPRVPKVKKHK